MPKYVAQVGMNFPDPSGARDEKGVRKDVRIEAGEDFDPSWLTPAQFESQLAQGAIVDVEPPPPAESEAPPSGSAAEGADQE